MRQAAERVGRDGYDRTDERWAETDRVARLLAAFLIGLFGAVMQNAALISTWAYCTNVAVPIVTDPPRDGEEYIWIGPLFLRVLVYMAAFVSGYAAARRWTNSGGAAAATFVGFAVCVLVFALDYSLLSGVNAGASLPDRCPGGHLPWWPI